MTDQQTRKLGVPTGGLIDVVYRVDGGWMEKRIGG
jgi:hypothetical protein